MDRDNQPLDEFIYTEINSYIRYTPVTWTGMLLKISSDVVSLCKIEIILENKRCVKENALLFSEL
jgi:hypothetical protein